MSVSAGERVRLRPLSGEDLDARLAMINDVEVQRITIGIPADQNTREDMASWFEMVSKDPFSEQWAIESDDGAYIGDIDLHSINVIPGEAWISPMVGDPRFRHDAAVRRQSIEQVLDKIFAKEAVEQVSIDIPDVDRQGIEILMDLGFEQTDEMEIDPYTGIKTLTLTLARPRWPGVASRSG